MSVTNRHELKVDAANDAPSDEGPEVAEKDVVFVLGNAVVDLSTLR